MNFDPENPMLRKDETGRYVSDHTYEPYKPEPNREVEELKEKLRYLEHYTAEILGKIQHMEIRLRQAGLEISKFEKRPKNVLVGVVCFLSGVLAIIVLALFLAA